MKRGVKGLIGLKRQFKIMDADGSGKLEFSEFKRALDDYRVGCNEEEVQQLFCIFDKTRDSTISFDEFLSTIVGKLNEKRTELV